MLSVVPSRAFVTINQHRAKHHKNRCPCSPLIDAFRSQAVFRRIETKISQRRMPRSRAHTHLRDIRAYALDDPLLVRRRLLRERRDRVRRRPRARHLPRQHIRLAQQRYTHTHTHTHALTPHQPPINARSNTATTSALTKQQQRLPAPQLPAHERQPVAREREVQIDEHELVPRRRRRRGSRARARPARAVLRPRHRRALERDGHGRAAERRDGRHFGAVQVLFDAPQRDEALCDKIRIGVGMGLGWEDRTWSILMSVSGSALSANFISENTSNRAISTAQTETDPIAKPSTTYLQSEKKKR